MESNFTGANLVMRGVISRRKLTVAIAPTIDTHAHYFPESYLKLIVDQGRRCGTTVVTEAGKTFIQVGLLLRTGPITSHFCDLDDRIETMDRWASRCTLCRSRSRWFIGRTTTWDASSASPSTTQRATRTASTLTASLGLHACLSRTRRSRVGSSSG